MKSKTARINIILIVSTIIIAAASSIVTHAGAITFNSKGILPFEEDGHQVIIDTNDFNTLYERCK